jgi:cupredoxin-like protein
MRHLPVIAMLCLLAAPPARAANEEVRLVIQDHKFQPAEVVVPARQKIRLIIENRDATPEEFESVALGREKLIAGKSSAALFIGPLAPGRYPFVGEFNENSAKGVVVAR